jgi:hypothetical protein
VEYLEFQGGLESIDDDGEGITLRFVPEMSNAVGKESPVFRVYIDQPENAEDVGKALVNYSANYEVESIGVENNSKLEIYFFDIESPVVICGQKVEILKTSLQAEDYEVYIQNMQGLLKEYSEESIVLYERLKSGSNLIHEIERRWEIKLEGHNLSSAETRLHKEFIKALHRVQHKLST